LGVSREGKGNEDIFGKIKATDFQTPNS
jgi:hypothetical protein